MSCYVVQVSLEFTNLSALTFKCSEYNHVLMIVYKYINHTNKEATNYPKKIYNLIFELKFGCLQKDMLIVIIVINT